MPNVETVLGPVDVSALGHCQLHEHLFVRDTPAAQKNPALRIDDEEKSRLELSDYRAAGGGMVLDAQPGGAGRDAMALSRISRASGVSIVTVTGFHRPMFYQPDSFLFEMDEGALFERFLMELQVGVADGGTRLPIRAGAVKAALGLDGPVGRDAGFLRAAAKAAALGNAPLVLHTEAGAGAVEAVKLAERMGLDPSRVLACHVDRQADDFRPHEEIASTGAYLEYDTISRFKYHGDEAEIRLILHMLEKGFRDRLLLSLDTTAARLRHYGGEIGLTYLIETFLPALKHCGVSEADIRLITRENPVRALAGQTCS
jgi:phosphotriesterase-related protein